MFLSKKQRPQQKKIIRGSIEQAYEFVKDTAHKAVEQTFDTLNPIGSLFDDEVARERKRGNNNFNELDIAKLHKAYAEKDAEEIERLQRLIYPEQAQKQVEKKEELDYHRRIQREEEEVLSRKRQEEEEKKRQEALEEREKKRLELEAAAAQQTETPKGKVRKSILGKQKAKASSELPPEFRPNVGKG